jgi:23S rRNA (cytosine1962-C5)-methyltransferase
MAYPKLILRRGKEVSLHRFHPWVFSGAVQHVPANLSEGSVVEIWSSEKKYLGTGHYQSGASILVRLLSFSGQTIDKHFWRQAIEDAALFRKRTGYPNADTNAYRLIHGEGDGLPGLIIDIYASKAVIQVHTAGMLLAAEEIADAIKTTFGDEIDTIYLRAKDTMPDRTEDRFLLGNSGIVLIREHGVSFQVDIVGGQKTGFFLDQRENRKLLGQYSHQKNILNCFSYTGGFSLYALKAGAAAVTSVDISDKAMAQLESNLHLNQFEGKHFSHCANVMPFLSDADTPMFDIVIVDPPAFAKSIQKRHNAVQAYKRLNELAIRKVKTGGLLFTFSCSQVVGTQLFYDTIVAAGIASGRKIRVIHQLSQGPDHPVQLFHPEGHYLKGLVLYIGDQLAITQSE